MLLHVFSLFLIVEVSFNLWYIHHCSISNVKFSFPHWRQQKHSALHRKQGFPRPIQLFNRAHFMKKKTRNQWRHILLSTCSSQAIVYTVNKIWDVTDKIETSKIYLNDTLLKI